MPRWRLFSYLVWATKGRMPLITEQFEPHVHRALRDVARRHGVIVHAVGDIEDHVHLAVSIPPALAVASAIQWIKGGSARPINEEFSAGFGWQAEYGVDSFAERHLATVIGYIHHQRRRHAEDRLWPATEEIPRPTPTQTTQDG